jgi:hypothetical protein
MSLGDDVRDAYIETGTGYVIKKSGEADSASEFCSYDVPEQVVRPFPREFILEGAFPYDTAVNEGSVIKFSDGRHFMVLSKIGVQFANALYEYQTQIIKCNVVNGRILRSTSENWANNEYHKVPIWSIIHEGVIGTITESLTGNILDDREDVGFLTNKNLDLYVSDSNYDLQVMDRFQPVSGESYRVDSIRKRVFPNVLLANLTEDTRE